MRAAIYASCLVLALAGQQKPSDIYASAVAKYVAGDSDAAFEALAQVPQADIQKELEGAVARILAKGGSPAARTRLVAMAMLHTEYALLGNPDARQVPFHLDMAHLAMSVSRRTLDRRVPDTTLADIEHARELLLHLVVLDASVDLLYGLDQGAAAIVDEALRFFPEDSKLLFWRGLVLEFHAVWVGTPATDPHATVPGMSSTDGSGFDLVKNARLWGPVEEAYRRALQHDADNPEVHLHLGYALASLRTYSPAQTEYEFARDRSTDPFVVYMADLLLARMKEDRNDVAGAAQHYEHALAKMPGAQSAYVGLGMLEARRGNTQRARELTTKLAAIPEKQRVRDPWWAYHTTRIPERDLEWLRKAVRQ